MGHIGQVFADLPHHTHTYKYPLFVDVHPFCASATVLIHKNVDEFAIADAQLFYEFFSERSAKYIF